jgi:formylglycine-generating enzyme required for sulfatase activity
MMRSALRPEPIVERRVWWMTRFSVSDPSGPQEGDNRVFRGGSYGLNAESVRAALRFGFLPSLRSPNHGFRVARGGTGSAP